MSDDLYSLEDTLKEVSNEHKLAVTQWVFKHIVEHAQEGGSYRYLIYDRLGFGPEAYAPLCSDGLTISNEFDLTLMDEIRRVIKEYQYAEYKHLKPVLNMCDEPDCWEEATCGWPSEDDGYRRTCYDHMKKEND